MTRRLAVALALVAACDRGDTRIVPEPAPEPEVEPEGRMPGLDLAAIDRDAAPCDDFYRYACGRWIEHHPMPPDRGRWSRFDALGEYSRGILRDILIAAAADDPGRSGLEQQVGDYYASCVDVERLDALGIEPLAAELAAIDRIATPDDLIAALAALHRKGVAALFSPFSSRGFRDSSRYLLYLDEGELGLASREDYLREEEAAVALRRELVEHVTRQLAHAAVPAEDARRAAGLVLAIDTELARAAVPPADRYDARNRDHPMTPAELEQRYPNLRFGAYLAALGVAAPEVVNVVSPGHMAEVDRLIGARPLDDWKIYLRWHLVREAAPFLSRPFLDEEARFQSAIGGQRAPEAREKRCTRWVESDLSHPVGQLYVARAFSEAAKARVKAMVQAIEAAMGDELRDLDWMSDATRREALGKLAAVDDRIGFPDRWRDYRGLRIVRGDALGNSLRANEFELRHQFERVGKPADPDEWLMAASVGNAYYENSANRIVFPAGILQPPVFDDRLDDAVAYGGIGFVIGHELSHGFDSSGRTYDASGSLRDWWTAEDAARFDERAQCFVDQYGGLGLDGKLTLGENIADHGGVRLALGALRSTGGAAAAPRDGFSPTQRFFLSYAQGFCGESTPGDARRRALTDHHAPGRERVNAVLGNMEEFAEAFACTPGQPMVREPRCRVW